VGKSVFAVQFANEISKNDKVLYFDFELSDKQFQMRYSEEIKTEKETQYVNPYIFNENLIRPDFDRPFSVPEGTDYNKYFIDCLKQVINTTGAKIVIIDNMTKLVSEDTDKARVAKPLMDMLTNLKFEYNLTMLLLEHTRKTDEYKPVSQNDLQGSKMKVNFADAVFCIGKSVKDKYIRYIKQLKCRSDELIFDAENVRVYEIVKEENYLFFKFLNHDPESKHLKQLTEYERENRKQQAFELKKQGLSNYKIADQFAVSEKTIRNWLKSIES
jgi:KaiC/GvpD/RAD55 family RecA-like ATPase